VVGGATRGMGEPCGTGFTGTGCAVAPVAGKIPPSNGSTAAIDRTRTLDRCMGRSPPRPFLVFDALRSSFPEAYEPINVMFLSRTDKESSGAVSGR
jgi:hypothetical protein